MTTDQQAEKLHMAYLRLTHLDRRFVAGDRWAWARWTHEGFTEADLELVVDYLRQRIAQGKRTVEALKFGRLIGDLESFRDDLSIATARARIPRVDNGRQTVLRATGRQPEPLQNTVRTAADILKAHMAFEDFKRMKETLK